MRVAWLNRIRAFILLRELGRAGVLPSDICVSNDGSLSNVVLFKEQDLNKRTVFCGSVGGFSSTPDVALLKAISEHIERLAFLDWVKTQPSKGIFGSTGFAAYPTVFVRKATAQRIARENAFHEALERYAWFQWWENQEIAHEVLSGDRLPPLKILTDMRERVLLVRVQIPEVNAILQVIYLETEQGGFVAGGGCLGCGCGDD